MTQPEALRLADALQAGADDPMWADHCEMSKRAASLAAAELRRLHEHNQELLKALKTITLMCESVGDFSNGVTDSTGTIDEGAILAIGVIQDARAAISKAEGQA